MIFLHLHHALNKVTQSANQHMRTFNFLFIKTYLKFLKTLPDDGRMTETCRSVLRNFK